MPHLFSEPPISSLRVVRYDRHRRSSRRLPANAAVEILDPRPGTGATLNISTGGLRVAIDCELCPGDVCLLSIDDPTRPAVERARVVWAHPLPDGCIAGLQLLTLH